jgi:hypothetical protein
VCARGKTMFGSFPIFKNVYFTTFRPTNLTDIGTHPNWPYTLTNWQLCSIKTTVLNSFLPLVVIRVEVYVSLPFSCNGQLIFSYVVILLGVQLTFVVANHS